MQSIKKDDYNHCEECKQHSSEVWLLKSITGCYYCQNCLSTKINELAIFNCNPPSWMIYLQRGFIRLQMRRIHWSYRLRNWISCIMVIKRTYDRCHTPIPEWTQRKINIAKWHVNRFKLMYEKDLKDKQINIMKHQEMMIINNNLITKGF